MRERPERAVACEACFSDNKLIELIRTQGHIGVCPWCGSSDVRTIRLEEIGPLFREVAAIYSPSDGLHGDPIGYLLQEDFGIFSELVEADPDLRDDLAIAILQAGLTKDDVDEPDYAGGFHRTNSSLEEDWDDQIDGLFRRREPSRSEVLTNSIDQIEFDPFDIAIEDLSTELPRGTMLVRARLHEERRRVEIYSLEELGAPPAENVKPQRANHADRKSVV